MDRASPKLPSFCLNRITTARVKVQPPPPAPPEAKPPPSEQPEEAIKNPKEEAVDEAVCGRRIMIVAEATPESKTALLWALSHSVQSNDAIGLVAIVKPSKRGESSIPGRDLENREKSTAMFDKEKAQERLSKLSGGVAVLKHRIAEQKKEQNSNLRLYQQDAADDDNFLLQLREYDVDRQENQIFQSMELQKVFCMNGGSGDLSYAKNSTIQNVIVSSTKSIREDAVKEFYCTFFPENMMIAELGCSSGPNAVFSTLDIMEAVEQRCRQLCRPPPEFHLLLNDLPANDFNTIFRSLPELLADRSQSCGQFFVSGVPGSFYGRLLPSKSLHFVHSSSSLHWLSQVPPELQDDSNAPLNKGKIYVSKTSPPCVAKAYLVQFQRDFSMFLKCRAKEIVAGGHMVLTFMGRRRGSDPAGLEYSYPWELLSDALLDMASKGIIKDEKINGFNAPYFSPSLDEVAEEIEREGSFSIRTLDVFEANWDAVYGRKTMSGELSHAKRMAKGVRAVVESMIKNQFGEDIMDELFTRYTSLLEEYYSKNEAQVTNIVTALIRK
ncbi:hypothetical protein Cni_G29114 [Canna indica]|uniref:Jasmonate O-methyltransferase n=1 Tax=Canna indica TaxID=4628 RepID=A0AAQ3QTP7_9LILI|nr:hypothetical protein Cni_G29114 [Canna indica]